MAWKIPFPDLPYSLVSPMIGQRTRRWQGQRSPSCLAALLSSPDLRNRDQAPPLPPQSKRIARLRPQALDRHHK
ncbi:hypothetical protein H0H93_006249 [Arthromyces matolae]|nr:hypothetical protein H0H93_006249 [Arthromyces matolae]